MESCISRFNRTRFPTFFHLAGNSFFMARTYGGEIRGALVSMKRRAHKRMASIPSGSHHVFIVFVKSIVPYTRQRIILQRHTRDICG